MTVPTFHAEYEAEGGLKKSSTPTLILPLLEEEIRGIMSGIL
jgi:hypothetical protein